VSARLSHAQAAAELARRDPAMRRLVSLCDPIQLRRPSDTHFQALVRSVIYQQLAGSAASAIHGRVIDALGGAVEPEVIMAVPDEQLRAAGLSANKLASLKDLATKVLDGTVVLDGRRLARESDEEVVSRLTTVRGIGEWTAQMFLLFQLRRIDVWPTGDLGVRRGYGLAWGVPMPTAKELLPLGDHLRPYRSVAAWYCWRACEIFKES
jgi:DNA-3-methyladenine glycosylase II